MPWQHVRVSRFGGPEVLELAEEQTIPDPGPGEVRIKVLAAGTGFTDSFIRRGRYPVGAGGHQSSCEGVDNQPLNRRTKMMITSIRLRPPPK